MGTTVTIPPLDPNIFTGPTRNMSGVARTASVTLDVAYGTNGQTEFMRWLYVGGAGNISYQNWDGSTTTLVGLLAGVWHPIYSTKVFSVGTTATSIVVGS